MVFKEKEYLFCKGKLVFSKGREVFHIFLGVVDIGFVICVFV